MFNDDVLLYGDDAHNMASKKSAARQDYMNPATRLLANLPVRSPERVCADFYSPFTSGATQEGGAKLLEQIQSIRLPPKRAQNNNTKNASKLVLIHF